MRQDAIGRDNALDMPHVHPTDDREQTVSFRQSIENHVKRMIGMYVYELGFDD